MNFKRSVVAFSALAILVWFEQGAAQVPPNCLVETATNPDRQVLKCAFGLTLELEAAAELEFSSEVLATEPTEITLQNGAVFIDVEPGAARPQIRTPHAIAAVRGTVYLIDVSFETTSVFVVEGEVSVSRSGDQAESITLRSGEGVDVTAGFDLEVKTWPASRSQALLARFGK
ncbi:FecR domain-containing protein [Roseobacter sp.]|uniref:FecR domain-containing protein n=1 Tax=Roseobacter sp. TaxID=1907202 RepID=UPI00385DCDEE